MPTTVTSCVPADAPELSEVAAMTFPLACPGSVRSSDVAAFVAEHLSERRFAEYLDDPRRMLLAARHGGRIVGYAMVVRETGDDGAQLSGIAELSKLYVVPEHHGTGVAAMLMDAAIAGAREHGIGELRLGVNQKNERAQRFYRKNSFAVTGTRTFALGSTVQDDYVMSRRL